MDVRGRTVVITGASRGLGAGVAHAMHAAGMRVAVCARTTPALPEGERVLARQLDVADAEAVARLAEAAGERFGAIDLWINNAGVLGPIAPLRSVSAEAFDEHVRINLHGVFHGTRAFVHHVRQREGEGVLLNISSGAARRPYHGWSAYCASKAAVDRLTECVALEERAAGLRAHAVAPGVIDTDMQAMIRASTAENFAEVERFRARKREGRFATAEHVAQGLLALAFDPKARADEVIVTLPEPPASTPGSAR